MKGYTALITNRELVNDNQIPVDFFGILDLPFFLAEKSQLIIAKSEVYNQALKKYRVIKDLEFQSFISDYGIEEMAEEVQKISAEKKKNMCFPYEWSFKDSQILTCESLLENKIHAIKANKCLSIHVPVFDKYPQNVVDNYGSLYSSIFIDL